MSSSSSKSKMIVLKSSDDKIFEIEESAAAILSQTIKNMIEDIDCTYNAIPLGNVNAKTLAKVIEYCNMHAKAEKASSDKSVVLDYKEKEKEKEEEDLNAFDKKFVDIDLSELFDLLLAANYMDIKKLLDLISQAVADKIKNNTVEEVREIFNIVNDFTPEEEKTLRQHNSWAYE